MGKRRNPLQPEVARTIAARRRALGLSQNALALATGLTEGALAKYETLRCPIPPQVQTALERALAEAEGRECALTAAEARAFAVHVRAAS